ncbi:MAG: cation diffusion facilitator family transporter [Actinomycetota bacterium]|nr:cation diffusion facilitator family transporter [Actinomycetota bacterium]
MARERSTAAGNRDEAELRRSQERALWLALVANALFLLVEAGGGVLFNSLALLADAAHMLSDVAALAIALVAQRLLVRPATAAHSYGLQRAEVLGAQANGLVLLVASVSVTVEAAQRIGSNVVVVGDGLLLVASLGLVVNLGSVALLARVQGESLNLRAAVLHLVADAVGSVGAMFAGIVVLVWDVHWVDSVVSVFIAALVLWSAWTLLREATHVLLEGTPRGLDVEEVERALLAHPAVEAVHHLHAWSLASDLRALSAHVVITEEVSLHDAQVLGDELKSELARRFAIEHSTLELECHVCDVEASGAEPH